MKIYPTKYEIVDESYDLLATFEVFDEESLSIELKQSIWDVEDFKQLAFMYEKVTKELTELMSVSE